MEDTTWLHLAIFVFVVIGTGILGSLLKRLDPLFESLYSTRSFDEQKVMPEWINELYRWDWKWRYLF